jgi:hypothetical protein
VLGENWVPNAVSPRGVKLDVWRLAEKRPGVRAHTDLTPYRAEQEQDRNLLPENTKLI